MFPVPALKPNGRSNLIFLDILRTPEEKRGLLMDWKKTGISMQVSDSVLGIEHPRQNPHRVGEEKRHHLAHFNCKIYIDGADAMVIVLLANKYGQGGKARPINLFKMDL